MLGEEKYRVCRNLGVPLLHDSGFFIEQIFKLEHKVICLLILYSPVVRELPDDDYVFLRHNTK